MHKGTHTCKPMLCIRIVSVSFLRIYKAPLSD